MSQSNPFGHGDPASRARLFTVSCTCGTWQTEANLKPAVCPRCGAPERCQSRATDFVRPPWEEIDAGRRMWGVFDAEGLSPDPVAILRSEKAAVDWLEWQKTRGDEAEIVGAGAYVIMAIDQLDGVVWNSFAPAPERE